MFFGQMFSAYLLVNEAKQSNADLHAKVMEAEDGGLQKNEASGEEEAQPQGQVVSLTSLRSVEGIEGSNDASRKLRLHSLRSFLQSQADWSAMLTRLVNMDHNAL